MNQTPNVISIADTKKHLTTVLRLFREGGTEPLIFGTDGYPEAVIIPYEQFQRLVQYDTQAHRQDQQLLVQRKKDTNDNPDEVIAFEDFVETLDPELQARLRKDGEQE